MTIGKNIQEIREARGLSVEFMADKLALSQDEYLQIENNNEDPRLSTLNKIAVIFGCSVSYLLTLKEQEGYNNSFYNHAGYKGNNNLYQGLPAEDLVKVFNALYDNQLKRIPKLEILLKKNNIELDF